MQTLIEFRAKCKTTGKWIYGDLVTGMAFSPNSDPIDYAICLDNDYTPVDGETVGQFLKIYDRDANPIYEGDILDFDEKEWGSKFRPEIISYQKLIDWELSGTFNDISNYRTVIGNLFDNPELIKQ